MVFTKMKVKNVLINIFFLQIKASSASSGSPGRDRVGLDGAHAHLGPSAYRVQEVAVVVMHQETIGPSSTRRQTAPGSLLQGLGASEEGLRSQSAYSSSLLHRRKGGFASVAGGFPAVLFWLQRISFPVYISSDESSEEGSIYAASSGDGFAPIYIISGKTTGRSGLKH